MDKRPVGKNPVGKRPMDDAIARLMGLGERSVQKSYYPQLQQKIKELEKSEARYRLLAENISDVIWMLDSGFCIAYISPSIERMSGYSSQELLGKPFTSILDPLYAQKFSNQISKEINDPVCLEQGAQNVNELELEQKNKDGSITWIEVRVSCLPGDDQTDKQILGISRDITSRKNAELEKETVQNQLIQAQKMESVGTLAGGIAHDFNNLLTIINGYSELMLGKTEEDHPLFSKITAISHAGKRAENLTRQLLAFSRKQIFKPIALDINATVSDMDQMLRRLIGEDIHVETIMEEGISAISADQSQIEQIFTNLVVNARDALISADRPDLKPDFKKRITIETGQTLFTPITAKKVYLSHPGLYVFFSVSDNGRGMDREIQKRIFEPFFTTKSKYKGTGLGLAMIYGIVKQNHGSIQVYSESNQGTLFKVYWPATTRGVNSETHSKVISEDLSGDETILLVEDDQEVLSFASNALMSLGYDIHRAENGKIALELIEKKIKAREPLPHLVVTDLIMPELSGKEFIQKAKTIAPEMKVIYVSGHTDNHIVHDGILEDGVNFLQKPYSQQRLARIIRAVLTQQVLK